MSLSAFGNYLDSSMRACQEAVKNRFDSITTDRNKTLFASAVLNAGTAALVAHTAIHTENYNPREWWSDVAVHALTAITCTAELFTPSNVSEPIKSMLAAATSTAIFANKARLAGILVSVGYNTQTIPLGSEDADIISLLLSLGVLEKYGTK